MPPDDSLWGAAPPDDDEGSDASAQESEGGLAPRLVEPPAAEEAAEEEEGFPEFRPPPHEPRSAERSWAAEAAAPSLGAEWESPDDLLRDLAVPRPREEPEPAEEPGPSAEAAPAAEAEPESEPQAEPEPMDEPDAEAEPELEVEARPEPEGEAEPESESEAVAEPLEVAASEIAPEPEVELEPGDVGMAAEPEAAPEADEIPVAEPAEPAPHRTWAARPPASPPAPTPPMPDDGFVPPRPWLRRGAQAWIAFGAGDTVSVEPGEQVTPTTVLGEHLRDPRALIVAPRDRSRFEPGSRITPEDVGGRGRGALTEEGTVLYRTTGGRVAVVAGREREPVHARVDGTVVAVTPGGVSIAVAGWALDGVAGAGRPVDGRLRIGVGDPGDELRSTGLHVADAGGILVAGARVDVETLTRARALGIHGVITGGIAAHDLRAFQQSEARQQAALHPLPAFAVFVVEGFGRRSLAGPPWDLLRAAAGTAVSIFPDPPLLVFAADAELPAIEPGIVRIAAGPGAGTVGRIDGPPSLQRFDEGVRLLAVPFVGGGRRSMVPLADLERFQ